MLTIYEKYINVNAIAFKSFKIAVILRSRRLL